MPSGINIAVSNCNVTYIEGQMKAYLTGLILALALAGYSQGTTNMSEKTEEYLNPGAPIQVNVGQTFTIRMQSNPSTGYGWQLSKALDNRISLVTNVFLSPDSKLMGAGGHEIWTFKAVAQGQTEIAMEYVRPWENDQPPVRTNVFKVIVKAP
jgi:inhibitor of cysteine peptidase